MTTTADRPDVPAVPALPAPRVAGGIEIVRGTGEVTVAVRGTPGGPRTAPALSCRLHEAIAAASTGDVLTVDLGAVSAADTAVERVLVCARECATSRGLTFRLL